MKLDTVYVRNLIRYSFTAAAEQAIMGSSLRDVPNQFSFNDSTLTRWKPPRQRTSQWHRCPSMPGLFMTAQAIKPDDLKDVLAFVNTACIFPSASSTPNGNSIAHAAERGPSRWVWFEYDARRFMAPVLLVERCVSSASSSSSASTAANKLDALRDFEVFGASHPPEKWLRVSAVMDSVQQSSVEDEKSAAALHRGAQTLQSLPSALQAFSEATEEHQNKNSSEGAHQPSDAARNKPLDQHVLAHTCSFEIGQSFLADPHTVRSYEHARRGTVPRELMQECHFAQLQVLERGVPVRPHIDAASPPAEVIATVVLQGEATVRVGAAELNVMEGDAYLICGPARWGVKHEVLASSRDRVSVTLRFSSPASGSPLP